MHRLVMSTAIGTVGLAILLSFGSSSRTQELQPEAAGVDVQAFGSVHEAFAQPDNALPDAGPVVGKQPPDPIEELPPDQKPEGSNIQWIPGYWAFEGDANEFMWISGCWRAVPPGKHWMPGHWQHIDTGWVWASGFWTPDNVQQVQYLPPPPPTLDKGPSVPAPTVDSFYAPGCWVYRESRYLWRPGHWAVYQPRWVWIPARYVWTPAGCVFVEDHWDYPLEECGLLFAPVRFDLRVWLGLRRPYVPRYVVHCDFLLGALFIHPGHRRYYFGDYFDVRFTNRGFVAWTDYRRVGAFDPYFGYYRHQHIAEPKWEVGLRDLYSARRSGEVPRPPRTLALQVSAINKIGASKTTNVFVQKNINITQVQNVTALAPLNQIQNVKVTGLGSLSQVKESKVVPHVVKLQGVSKEDLAREQKIVTQMHDLSIQRRDSEAKMLVTGGIPVKHTDPPKTVKFDIPKPPAAAKAPVVVRTPPAVVVTPKHEERVIPKYDPPKPPGPPKKAAEDKKDKKDSKKG